MSSTLKSLPNDVEELQKVVRDQGVLLERNKAHIAVLEEIIRAQKQKRFGNSSEKHPSQGELFNEVEAFSEENELIETTQVNEDTPAITDTNISNIKTKPGRKPLPKDLPRIQKHICLSDDEKVGALRTFFVFAKEELDIVPAQIRVIEYYQEKAVFPDEMLPAIKTATLQNTPFLVRLAALDSCRI